jgi:hypothetical protein
MADRVGSAMSKSGMVDNVVVAIGIALPALFVQNLFPLPVSAFTQFVWIYTV